MRKFYWNRRFPTALTVSPRGVSWSIILIAFLTTKNQSHPRISRVRNLGEADGKKEPAKQYQKPAIFSGNTYLNDPADVFEAVSSSFADSLTSDNKRWPLLTPPYPHVNACVSRLWTQLHLKAFEPSHPHPLGRNLTPLPETATSSLDFSYPHADPDGRHNETIMFVLHKCANAVFSQSKGTKKQALAKRIRSWRLTWRSRVQIISLPVNSATWQRSAGRGPHPVNSCKLYQ